VSRKKPTVPEDDPTLLLAALNGLASRAPIDSVDQLWIFPSRKSGKSESAVVVASAFVAEDESRRRVLTAHSISRQEMGKRVRQEVITEQGIAPADRVGRLVDGVMRRLDEELAALPPRAVQIGGELARWEELIRELTAPVDLATDPAAPAAAPAATSVP
jgi:hypothetical protein